MKIEEKAFQCLEFKEIKSEELHGASHVITAGLGIAAGVGLGIIIAT